VIDIPASIFNMLKLDMVGRKVKVTTPRNTFTGTLSYCDDYENLVIKTEDGNTVFIQRKFLVSLEVL
jgi:small nuclear ribonucleoprotein (snRNP)-like protein